MKKPRRKSAAGEPAQGISNRLGCLFRDEDRPGLVVEKVGSLRVVSGEICVCDPFVAPIEADPLGRRLAPGDYAASAIYHEGAVAVAIVEVAEGSLVRWESGAEFTVDGGSVAVMDLKLARTWDESITEELEDIAPTGVFDDEDETGATAVIFESGQGDGTYEASWGIDGQGNPVWLVLDFGVLETKIR